MHERLPCHEIYHMNLVKKGAIHTFRVHFLLFQLKKLDTIVYTLEFLLMQ